MSYTEKVSGDGGVLDILSDSSLKGREITVGGRRLSLHEVVGRGRKGAVWRARNEYGRDRAVKLADASDYDVRQPGNELTLGLQLEDYKCFARLEAAERLHLSVGGEEVAVVVFVSQWLEGYTLEAILADGNRSVTPALIRAYVDAVCDGLAALDHAGLIHDDLNFGNVFAALPPAGQEIQQLSFKIIDLGSLKVAENHNTVSKSGIDDYRWVGLHLAGLHNAAIKRSANSSRERRFLNQLPEIIRFLLEADPVVRIRNASALRSQIESAWTRSAEVGPRSPATPFEFISAEQIADDQVLRQIFSQSIPWLDSVNTATRQVITGPRGCGKSMLFRWLALRTQLRASLGSPAEFHARISGFYISCTIDMQNRLGWIGDSEVEDELRDEVVHFFNLLCIREVVRTLAFCRERQAESLPLQLSESDESVIVNAISDAIGGWGPELFQGVSRLRQLSGHLRDELRQSHLRMRGVASGSASVLTQENVLGELTAQLVDQVPFFREYPIVFLLDDFSFHRVPRGVQEVLHPIVFQRTPSHSFKVSAEKNGTVITLASGSTAEKSREFDELDFGSLAVEKSARAPMRRFARELLDARLIACGYQSDARTLLGKSDWGEDEEGRSLSLAEAIRTKPGQTAVYHGLNCVADLCTGDVSALLMVLERIFRQAKVGPGRTTPVKKSIQDKAIKSVSTDLVEQIRSYYGTGPRMHAFVTEFGRFISAVLNEAPLQGKGEGAQPQPQQIPRIEVDSISGALDKIESVPFLNELYEDLVRRAILIEVATTRGIHDNETTLRLHLRRVYLPSFRAALGKNSNLILSPDRFAALLADPKVEFKSHRDQRVIDPSSSQGAGESEQIALEFG